MCVRACVRAWPYQPLRLLITSGMIWIPYDWLNMFYSFHVAAVIRTTSRCGLSIDAHSGNMWVRSKQQVKNMITTGWPTYKLS